MPNYNNILDEKEVPIEPLPKINPFEPDSPEWVVDLKMKAALVTGVLFFGVLVFMWHKVIWVGFISLLNHNATLSFE